MDMLSPQALHRYTGSPEQLFGVRRTTLEDGTGAGLRLFEVCTAGGLQLDVFANMGLDIGAARYKGHNISYLAKNGYDSPARFSQWEDGFSRSFPAGLLYTCGLRTVGGGNRDGQEWQPTHGHYHALPVTNPSAYVEDGTIHITGTMRETALFGHFLQLRRHISIPAYGSEITIEDTLENLSPAAEEFMLLYHFNIGYPLLNQGARLILPQNRTTTPRTPFAQTGLGRECEMDGPIDGQEEQVYFHQMDEPKAELHNAALGLGLGLRWSGDTLPILAQWRSMASGDYVLGLEPTNGYIMGRNEERKNGSLQVLEPFGRRSMRLTLRLFELD